MKRPAAAEFALKGISIAGKRYQTAITADDFFIVAQEQVVFTSAKPIPDGASFRQPDVRDAGCIGRPPYWDGRVTARVGWTARRAGAVAMRVAGTLVTLTLLTLAAALPAAGQPALPPSGTSAPPDRGAYLQRMSAEMDAWRLKLHGMGEKAKVEGQQAATAAEVNLRAAWSRMEVDASTLRTATASKWDDAKLAFERASIALSRAWDEARL